MRVEARLYYTIAANSPEVAVRVGALARERIGGLQGIVAAEPPKARVTLFGPRWDTATGDARRFLGLETIPQCADYDSVIVGGGPAGLAAAVYGASEGLHTLVVEREAPGGQAGTSSRIENYLDFRTVSPGRSSRHARSSRHDVSERRFWSLEVSNASTRQRGRSFSTVATCFVRGPLSWLPGSLGAV